MSRSWMLVIGTLLAACGDEKAAEPTEPERVSLAELEVGACVAPAGGDTLDVKQVELGLCNGPHAMELAGRITLPEGEYPGRDALSRAAYKSCIPTFEGYVATGFEASAYDIQTVTPTRSAWSQGKRTAHCMVVAPNGQPLTERARGSRR